MILLVHIQNKIEERGAEWATRAAWSLAKEEAHKVHTVIGVADGRVKCVIESTRAVKVDDNNILDMPFNTCFEDLGRYVFIKGECYVPQDVLHPMLPPIMFKKLSFGQGHRYIDTTTVDKIVSGEITKIK